jgi:hypothetical protein
MQHEGCYEALHAEQRRFIVGGDDRIEDGFLYLGRRQIPEDETSELFS